jgi:sulfite oxidase
VSRSATWTRLVHIEKVDRLAPSETNPTSPRADAPERPAPWYLGALAGLIAAAVGIAVGSLFAQLINAVLPTDAVGAEFIDRVPKWLKTWAVDWFGTNDKRALRVGMFVVMGLLAAVFGVLSLRDRWVGVTGFVLAGLVGAAAVIHRPTEPNRGVLGPIVGAVVGAVALVVLIDVLTGRWRQSVTPGRSQAPLGVDRRQFVRVAGTGVAVAAVATTATVALERRRVRQIESSAPERLPAVTPESTPQPTSGSPASTTPTDGAPTSTSPAESDTPTVDAAFAELNTANPFVTPNDDFYRIDTVLSFPRINVGSWKLRIHGMVDRELQLTYDDLLARPQVERMVTIACVSNEVGGDLIGNAVWQGVFLADVLREAGVQPGAEQVFGTSADGWTCGFPVAAALDGRDAMVVIGMNGQPLPIEHGFPARVIVPGLYGYVSATKWVTNLKLTTWDADEGYWVPRGWAREAPIKTQSRIDVPRRDEAVSPGDVVVAGVAWAQQRGIAKVEVRVDDGPWNEATLGERGSDDTWREWVYLWEATAGTHILTVRATDKTGYTQTESISRPDPDGATGWHSRRLRVRPS